MQSLRLYDKHTRAQVHTDIYIFKSYHHVNPARREILRVIRYLEGEDFCFRRAWESHTWCFCNLASGSHQGGCRGSRVIG